MSATPRQTIQIEASPELKQELETAAARLNLSLPAYLKYLQARQRPGTDPERLDRIVRQVFGRYGQVMRNLAR